jgi:hypothetical protein
MREELRNARDALSAHLYGSPAPSVTLTFRLGRDYDGFTDEDEKKLVAFLKKFCRADSEIRLVCRYRGSVLVTVEVEAEDAIRLMEAFGEGELKLAGVLDAKLSARGENSRPAVERSRKRLPDSWLTRFVNCLYVVLSGPISGPFRFVTITLVALAFGWFADWAGRFGDVPIAFVARVFKYLFFASDVLLLLVWYGKQIRRLWIGALVFTIAVVLAGWPLYPGAAVSPPTGLLRGTLGESRANNSGWILFDPPLRLGDGGLLKIKVGGNAKRIVVQVRPKGGDPDTPAGVLGEAIAVPDDRIVEVLVDADYPAVELLSVHGGPNPWGAFDLGDGNGPATVVNAEWTDPKEVVRKPSLTISYADPALANESRELCDVLQKRRLVDVALRGPPRGSATQLSAGDIAVSFLYKQATTKELRDQLIAAIDERWKPEQRLDLELGSNFEVRLERKDKTVP